MRRVKRARRGGASVEKKWLRWKMPNQKVGEEPSKSVPGRELGSNVFRKMNFYENLHQPCF